MQERERVLEAVFQHCDLKERLTLLPPSARARGLYFNSIETVLERAGMSERFRALFPERYATVLWHPAGELLVRLAVGGALLSGPENVHHGMYEIGRRNAVAFSESLIGRTMLRLLSRDPKKLLQQAVAGRRQSLSAGTWELTFPTPRSAVITMREEYLYLESYLLGAAQGTFDAIATPVRAEVIVVDRFNGSHVLSW